VEVSASSLYKAAVLAVKEFRSCSVTEVFAGKGTKLVVEVRSPAEQHEISVSQVERWLEARKVSSGAVHESPSQSCLASDQRSFKVVAEGHGNGAR